VIRRLGIDLPVVGGGQAIVDRGLVAHYQGQGWLAPTPPGAVGTYWLAAHHLTHGGPFRRLPSARSGDVVQVVTSGGRTYTYVVTSIEVVGATASYATVYGTDQAARALLLQTCLSDTTRLLVHGRLVASS